MPDVGEVRYKAKIDTSNLDGEIKKTESKLGGLDTSTEKTSSKFSSIGKVGVTALKGIGVAAVAAATSVAKMGIEYNAQMQQYQTAFTTMLGDAEKAQKLIDNLQTLASNTPLAMTDLADASQILLAFGSSAEELPDQLKRIGDVAQGNAQKLGTMATAFGRIQSNGYASLEEINMMIDQGFNPLNIIAEKTGETMAEVRKRVSEGGVSFEEISEALNTATSEGGQFFNAMENQSKTFNGQISTIQDNLSQLAGVITSGVFSGISENILPQIIENIDQILSATQEEGVSKALEVAGEMVYGFLIGLAENYPLIHESGFQAIDQLLSGITEKLPGIVEGAAQIAFTFYSSLLEHYPEILESGVNLVLNLVSGIIASLPSIIESAVTLASSLIQEIANHFPEILQKGLELTGKLIAGILSNLPALISAAFQLVVGIKDAFTSIDWIQLGKDVINGIIKGLSSLAGSLWNAAKSLANDAMEAIRGAFDSHSPSKKAIKLAKTVPQGLKKEWDEDTTAQESAKKLGSRAISQLTSDFGYKMPDVEKYADSLTSDFTGSYHAASEITVPLYLDGREIARASAWWMGEQLSWEEM